MGSASETENLCLLARDLAYLPEGVYPELQQQIEEVKRMLAALLKTIRAASCLLTPDPCLLPPAPCLPLAYPVTNPYFASSACPASDRTRSTNCCASSAWGALASTAIG